MYYYFRMPLKALRGGVEASEAFKEHFAALLRGPMFATPEGRGLARGECYALADTKGLWKAFHTAIDAGGDGDSLVCGVYSAVKVERNPANPLLYTCTPLLRARYRTQCAACGLFTAEFEDEGAFEPFELTKSLKLLPTKRLRQTRKSRASENRTTKKQGA